MTMQPLLNSNTDSGIAASRRWKLSTNLEKTAQEIANSPITNLLMRRWSLLMRSKILAASRSVAPATQLAGAT